jgi:opacity protein-like surface antigen
LEGKTAGVTYWGINGKLFLPIPIVQPYVMGGYGTYSVNIDTIGKDSNRGYNLGIGVEVKLGKLGIFAEGRYHKVKVDIEGELNMSNYTLTFGALYDF